MSPDISGALLLVVGGGGGGGGGGEKRPLTLISIWRRSLK